MVTMIRGDAKCEEGHTWETRFSMRLKDVRRTSDGDDGVPGWEFFPVKMNCPKCQREWCGIKVTES